MTRKLFILFIISFLAGCAYVKNSLVTPSEIESYCQHILGNSNNSSEEMDICIRQEHGAKSELAKITIPPSTENYCRKLAASTGGSYQVMLTCVQKDLAGKKRGK